jgi:hypothetical protein
VNAARYGRWENGMAAVVETADADLRRLLDEVDRPLMPGFMTAGYSALGRFIFLAAQSRGADRSPLG